MVSKNQISRITALQQKKYRQEQGLFVAEGVKVISELLAAGYVLERLFVSEADFENVPDSKKEFATRTELQKMSALSSPSTCLAVFEIPEPKTINEDGLIVALDSIRDPGNLGTIIRLCDWFGIADLVCSEQTVDCYNPKVVQASMGSLARVNISYRNLTDFFQSSGMPVLGTFMDGENVYKSQLPQNGILLMGNEANGISPDLEKCISKKLSVPRFGPMQQTESLNVATATAILLSEFRRSQF